VDEDVSGGSGITTVAGRLALGITLLAFGLGNTAVVDGVSAADATSIAQYVGGVALFVALVLMAIASFAGNDGLVSPRRAAGRGVTAIGQPRRPGSWAASRR
jgi:hypothetical protein